jgi:hypothetical protein
MTDIIKLAYEQGQMQALDDLGLNKEASLFRNPLRTIGKWFNNPDDVAFFANKANQEAGALLSKTEAAAEAARAARQATDSASLNAAIRAHLNTLDDAAALQFSRGNLKLPREIQDQYLRVHGRGMYDNPAIPARRKRKILSDRNPAPGPELAPDEAAGGGLMGFMKENPIGTILGGTALGGGAMYALTPKKEPSFFG